MGMSIVRGVPHIKHGFYFHSIPSAVRRKTCGRAHEIFPPSKKNEIMAFLVGLKSMT
jgi:hypothetical protein